MRLIVTLFFLALIGCSSTIDKNDVVGTYKANYKNATDTLEVYSNKTYKHTYKNQAGVRFENIGVWEFEDLEKEKIMLSFSKFKFNPDLPENKEGSFWIVEVEKPLFSQKMHLSINEDEGQFYIKD